MPAPQELLNLLDRFDQHRDDYVRGRFNETQLRRDYLDPFFEILGWDVANKKGHAEAYREVIHEDVLRIDKTIKAPDYSFRIGSDRKFFVEAKKPGVNIKDDYAPAYQVRRYAWSAKLPLSLLTDFEEWAVYDTRVKPDRLDRATVARIQYFRFNELPERWDEFSGVFSRDAILRGSFDKYVESTKTKKGTTLVDDEFLVEIDSWREMLAQNIALRNSDLSQRDLNFAVQRTIDRIIFLRICEDRGIEEYGRLKELKDGKEVYQRLVQLFHQADAKYNSGLFHFRKEKGEAESPDQLTTSLKIDDKILKDIARRLYYPDSPYEFSVFTASILGHVYERFLGKVIVLDKKHKATVEEKPEVRKAGGVYYTPDYISKYIVANTVGKLVENKDPSAVSEIRVLDPACGSGSFLIAAFDYLLDWHLRYYLDNDPATIARKKGAPIYKIVGGDGVESWRLTTLEKRRILLNNIYGVDIDQQAVEVTKLSLLLKVLENESEQTLGAQMKLLHERVLPDLGNNIKNGNSLIGPDYFKDDEYDDTSAEERAKVNAFDWTREFASIMQGGGFDAVIGNPPYVRQESLAPMKVYFASRFASYDSTADLYVYFIERGIRLLRVGGRFAIIVSSSFLRASYGKPLRQFISENIAIERFVDFGGLAVFRNAKDTYVCIPVLSKSAPTKSIQIVKPLAVGIENLSHGGLMQVYTIPSARLQSETWNLATEKEALTFRKILSAGTPLASVIDGRMYRGLLTGLNAAFEITDDQRKAFVMASPPCASLIKPVLGGQNIRRYAIRTDLRYLIVIPSGWTRARIGMLNGESHSAKVKAAWEWFADSFDPIARHLSQFQSALEKRLDKGEFWWELRSCDYYGVFEKGKIIFPDICKGPRFFLDDTHHYLTNTAYAIASHDPYLLAILNSRLFWFAIGNISIPFGVRAGEFRYRLIYQYMAKVPIKIIDNENESEVRMHTSICSLSTRMLTIHNRLESAKSAHDKTMIQREIDDADRRIDELVYELYGLTDDEIKVVEEGRTK